MSASELPLVVLTIRHEMQWRSPGWSESIPSRQGWIVTCPAHPKLGAEWAYASLGVARSVAARHGNARHQWPQHGERYDVKEIEATA